MPDQIVPHGPPIYEENPDLSPGEVKKVDYAVDGFDAVVYRTVYRDGEILHEDTFFSQYVPWQAVYQVAPGHLPGGYMLPLWPDAGILLWLWALV